MRTVKLKISRWILNTDSDYLALVVLGLGLVLLCLVWSMVTGLITAEVELGPPPLPATTPEPPQTWLETTRNILGGVLVANAIFLPMTLLIFFVLYFLAKQLSWWLQDRLTDAQFADEYKFPAN